MFRRSKKTIVLSAGLILTLLLASCGNEQKTETSDDVQVTSHETEAVESEDKAEEVAESEGAEETTAAEGAEEAAGDSASAQEESEIPSCVGFWKYDDYGIWLVVKDDLSLTSYDDSGNATHEGRFEQSGEGYLMFLDGDTEGNLYTFSEDGKLQDSDGDKLGKVEHLDFAASSDDALTESANFPGKFEAYTINYPSGMKATARTDLANTLEFTNKTVEKGSDDYYSNILVTFQPLVDVDKFMGKGAGLAKPCMGYLINNCMNTFYGDHILKSLGTDFQDMGNYYSVTGYMWLDGTVFQDASDKEFMGVMQMRYFGPTGYALIAVTIAPVDAVENYLKICLNMLDTCTYKTDWSTTPKTVPATAGSNRGKSKKATAKPKGNVSTASDSGDYGTAFYWTDEDGDIWYWNGYENIFQSFGTDGYIDDDGEFYESNDAGWDVDNYVDDYEIYSDPGDGDDAWSDPGDTDDYEIYSDPGDGDDAWSDPGDSYDYGDYDDYDY